MTHAKLITWSSDPRAPRLFNPILTEPGQKPAHRYACALTLAEATSCLTALNAATGQLLNPPGAYKRTLSARPSQQQPKHKTR